MVPQVGSVAGRSTPDPNKHLTLATSGGLATEIFTNNIRVALLAFAGGITAGLVTGWLLLFNGALVGLLAGVEVADGNGSVFFQLVVPHGLLELSLIAVAGAAGFRFAGALVRPGRRRRSEALQEEGRGAVEMALGSALWLIPCGLVEGFVTPAGFGLPVALGGRRRARRALLGDGLVAGGADPGRATGRRAPRSGHSPAHRRARALSRR